MNRCWPLSTSPALGSSNEYARPPRCGFFSRTRTRFPLSASATAHARPAKPPPRTRTSGVSEAMAVEPGAEGERELAVARERRLLEQDAEAVGLDLVEQALVE